MQCQYRENQAILLVSYKFTKWLNEYKYTDRNITGGTFKQANKEQRILLSIMHVAYAAIKKVQHFIPSTFDTDILLPGLLCSCDVKLCIHLVLEGSSNCFTASDKIII